MQINEAYMKKDMNDQCTMIDLFAGCGGLSLGFEMADLHHCFSARLI